MHTLCKLQTMKTDFLILLISVIAISATAAGKVKKRAIKTGGGSIVRLRSYEDSEEEDEDEPIANRLKAETNILNVLLRNYQLLTRPINKDTGKVTVKIGIKLINIYNIDENVEIMTTVLWKQLEWNDPSLVWDPPKYANISSLRIPVHRIWKPEIFAYNILDDQFDPTFQTSNKVTNNGDVSCLLPGIYRTSCKFSHNNFPFDKHICEIKFRTWAVEDKIVDLQLIENGAADNTSSTSNSEWELLEFSARKTENPEGDINFVIHLKRRGQGILLEAKFANLMIYLTLFGSLLISPASYHKITLGLLQFSISLAPILFYRNQYPNQARFGLTSDTSISLICYFYLWGLLSVLALVENILVFWLFRFSFSISKEESSYEVQKSEVTENGRGRNRRQKFALLVDRAAFVVFILVGAALATAVFLF